MVVVVVAMRIAGVTEGVTGLSVIAVIESSQKLHEGEEGGMQSRGGYVYKQQLQK